MMPRRNKRKRQLAANAILARESTKRSRSAPEPTEDTSQPSSSNSLNSLFSFGSGTDSSDQDYDPAIEIEQNPNLKLETFLEEWVLSLDRDDTISLGLFLDFHLKTLLRVNATTAAEYTSIMMGKSEKTIRTWINKYFDNGAEIKENIARPISKADINAEDYSGRMKT